MKDYAIVIGIIVICIIIWYFMWGNVEGMASDGGALIQLQAKGPEDEYLIPNARKYAYWPYYYYATRPKRSYRYGWWPWYPSFRRRYRY
jgi:hypothetical protein